MSTHQTQPTPEPQGQGSPKRKAYMTLCGLPISIELEWPFRA